jgi:hypothetical protein
MPDYVIEVRYGDAHPTARIPLHDVTPTEAENDRQFVLHQIEHARELNAPCMIEELQSGPLAEHVEIPVDGVVEVDLAEA